MYVNILLDVILKNMFYKTYFLNPVKVVGLDK